MGDTPSLPNSKIEAEDRHANFYDARVNLKHTQGELEVAAPPLHPSGLVAGAGRDRTLRPGRGEDRSLPLPGSSHPDTVDPAGGLDSRGPGVSVWRARCRETGTPVRGAAPGKRTSREAGTAPRADPTGTSTARCRFAAPARTGSAGRTPCESTASTGWPARCCSQ